MNPDSGLRQLGSTQQKLLRALLQAPQGADIEALCKATGVTHNAVRQHLTALIAAGWVARGASRASGGRPRACYVLEPAGRELFPRNYGVIAQAMLQQLSRHRTPAQVREMLAALGEELGRSVAAPLESDDDAGAARALANQLDALGYEALAFEQDGQAGVEAWNCVFHDMARETPEVCAFDIAFMQAASGRHIEHAACMLRGSPACRFHIGTAIRADKKA